jgi:hypothetical protein
MECEERGYPRILGFYADGGGCGKIKHPGRAAEGVSYPGRFTAMLYFEMYHRCQQGILKDLAVE